jgi:hypothetical protein
MSIPPQSTPCLDLPRYSQGTPTSDLAAKKKSLPVNCSAISHHRSHHVVCTSDVRFSLVVDDVVELVMASLEPAIAASRNSELVADLNIVAHLFLKLNLTGAGYGSLHVAADADVVAARPYELAPCEVACCLASDLAAGSTE